MKPTSQAKLLVAAVPAKSFRRRSFMRDHLENIIRELKEVLADLDKVEAGAYGYKSAAPRARKALMKASKDLRDIRGLVQEAKSAHEEK